MRPSRYPLELAHPEIVARQPGTAFRNILKSIMQSKAATVAEYLKELPKDRRAAISKVRSVIRKHLPRGFKEQMGYGMIGYVVPHSQYPPGYHCNAEQPLPFAFLA